MKKKIIVILLIVLVIAAGIFAVMKYMEYRSQVTGEEWFEKQAGYMEDFETYADSMDDVFALYLSGNIGEEDFLNHLDILKSELGVMEMAYKEELKAHPVRRGTHTYATKKGCEAVDDCFGIFSDIIDMAYANYADVNTLSYKYLASQEFVTKALGEYMAAKDVVKEEMTNE